MKSGAQVFAGVFTVMLCIGVGAITAAYSATVYVNQNANHFQVYKAGKSWSITSSAIYSPVGMAIQPLGDLVFANREVDKRAGTIVTLPPGKGALTAKYVIKCKGLTPWGITLDADSNIWMANYESNEIRQYARHREGLCDAAFYNWRPRHEAG